MSSPYLPLKVYLAAPFEQRDEMLAIKKLLEGDGFLVTSTWLTAADGNDSNMATIGGKFHECRTRALQDFEDIKRADVLVLRKPKETHKVPTTGGHHVELGYCLGAGKPIILFGDRENVFHYVPSIQVVKTTAELMILLHGVI